MKLNEYVKNIIEGNSDRGAVIEIEVYIDSTLEVVEEYLPYAAKVKIIAR